MTTEKIEKIKSNLEIIGIIISFLCFWCWLMFIICCFLAIGSRGPYGSILETGVYMIKYHPIISAISLIPAGFFVRCLNKI